MIKIKEFAKLCQCSTQTLRYYDQVNLLSPVFVDQQNGYRYYESKQLYDYVRIKNLQLADFSITEIKELLKSPDTEVVQAFEQKIVCLRNKLKQIKKIKNTYHIESSAMKKVIDKIKEKFTETFQPELAKKEYDLSDSQLQGYLDSWESLFMDALLSNTETSENSWRGITEEQIMEAINNFDSSTYNASEQINLKDYRVRREFHAWSYLHEIMAELTKVNDKDNLTYYLEVSPDKAGLSFALPTILLQKILEANEGKTLSLNCQVQPSEDGANHIYILEK